MAYPEHLLSPDERIETEFRPHWTALIAVVLSGAVAVAGIVASLVWLDATARVLGAVGAVVLWLLFASPRLLTWATTQHVVTTERVIHRAGVFSRRGKEIPLENINDVAFGQTVIERLLGSGDLLIESAGELGQTHYTDIPHPERLQSLIYRLRERRIVQLRGSAPSAAAEIEALARLLDQGILSAEEFETQKRKLLDG